ncbi:MAG: class I SAM-dependent methyltransferase [Bacteriovoracaceae bacterium]|nr:class I SAM-dependent methyltransferase [Bacteriovoracaceae bacterium]
MLNLKEMKTWKRVPLSDPGQALELLFAHFPKMRTHFATIPPIDGLSDWSLVWSEEQSVLEFLAIEYTPANTPFASAKLKATAKLAQGMAPLMIKSSVFSTHRSGSGGGGFGGGDLDPLIKSLWGKKYFSTNLPELVVDGTAGLLSDAFKMLPFTKKIFALERNKLLQLLIAHYVSYVQEILDSTSPKIQFAASELSPEILKKVLGDQLARPWILYLDPMFDSKEKSMAKGSMQMLKQLTLGDGVVNWDELLDHFQSIGQLEKIVVKRWINAPYLFSKAPTYQIESKLVRYDIYQQT